MTEDCRINLYYPVTTIIYVFLHTRYQFKSFVLTGDALKTLVKKINYDLQENDWNEIVIEEISFTNFVFVYTNIYDQYLRCQEGRFLENKTNKKGVWLSRLWRDLLELIWWKVLLKWTWNEYKCLYFILCIHLVSRLTPYYNMIFLIVKMGGVDVSIINGSQGSLTLYEHEPFSWSSKKSLTERIHNIYITPVMYSFQVFHYKRIRLHIYMDADTD